ncbi:MAG: 4-(cytidine 5'-diphospho)-2-C-methyl-D-erythritol kinase [Caldisericia bacterium]|nr:4-(cytidine 5'-diphospho)-2-C-methyl-D-erythritol kinase [Caldisericia bacterium]MDD4614147.1 4-(cytidine 5'-diphospho)-2-C-methyl-D-erythritol kinase [Caldisericia bacterium]
MKKPNKYFAYAKLNLQLRVIGLARDGFHLLDMVNVLISLHDDVTIDIRPERRNEIFLSSSRNFFTHPQKNLLYKAWDWYTKKTGIPISAKVHLYKRIPIGSGMGGGSSDAATLLRILNNLFQGMTEKELIQESVEIGSDVPYFLIGGLCRVTGKGENIQTLPENEELSHLHGVVCFPRKNVSTTKVYALYDENNKSFSQGLSDDFALFPTYNDLTPSASEIQPSISQCLSFVNSTKPAYYGMSGSGSACFGLYTCTKSSKNAMDFLLRKGYRVWLVETNQKRNYP